MATAEFVAEMAAGQQTAVQPYMFEPESDPEQQEAPEESQQPRMNMDVSQWLVVKFVTSTLLLCYCID
ncbi:hypothetical protein ABVT39_005228 [Epinephelus coioides]